MLLKLNPYAKTMKRNAILFDQQCKEKKDAAAAKRRGVAAN